MGIFDRFKKSATATRAPEGTAEGDQSPAEPQVEPAEQEVNAAPSKSGMFAQFRTALQKTARILNTDIRDLFKREGDLLDDLFLDRLFELLVRTDMGVGPARQIRERIAGNYRGRVVHMADILADVKGQLREIMGSGDRQIHRAAQGPTVVLIVGVNGSGKTTTIAKLAHRFASGGERVVLGAGDTFRAAAVDQLKIWAERVGAEFIAGTAGADPASVAHRAVARALECDAQVCIVDTAGRLQTQVNLMDQLAKIKRVIEKLVPEAPHEVLLVLDATAGQNGISQARGFSEAVQCTGIVLAKLDGSAKGGVVIPIHQQFQLPVKFVGIGEKMGDLAPFDPDAFTAGLFDHPN